MKLLMVRHGEIHSNRERVYAGKNGEALTARGVVQAEEVASKLQSYAIDALYSSPIYRAVQTVRIIGEKIGKEPIIDSSFREMEMGPWEGMSELDVELDYQEEWRIWNNSPAELNLPGRERLGELLARVLKGIQAVYEKSDIGNVVIVTHVAVIRVLLLWYARKSLNLYKTISVPNAKIFEIASDTFS